VAKKVGRPTKYNPDVMLPKLKELAERGALLEEVPCELGIAKSTMNEWANPGSDFYQEEFSVALKEVVDARDRRIAKLLEDIASGANQDGNASAAIFLAKNTIGYRDRIETENKTEIKTDVTFSWGGE
jgi:hypothetical protein